MAEDFEAKLSRLARQTERLGPGPGFTERVLVALERDRPPGIAAAYVHREVGEFASEPPFRERARMRGLARMLDLDAAQRDRIRAIMERHHGQRLAAFSDMMDNCGRGLRQEKEQMDSEIRAV